MILQTTAKQPLVKPLDVIEESKHIMFASYMNKLLTTRLRVGALFCGAVKLCSSTGTASSACTAKAPLAAVRHMSISVCFHLLVNDIAYH